MTNGREVIPSRWNYRKISEVTTKVGSGSTPRGGESVYQDSGVPLIRSMNVHSSGFKSDGLAFIDADEAKKLDHVIVQPSDVLLNITGASIGRVTTAPDVLAGARVNQHVCIIRPKEELSSSFLSYFLASPKEQSRVMNVQVGATRQALTKAMILDWDVPVPPLHEQQEIVAEIEKQFSRLDEAVANLKRAKANLKRYKASVLKAAVEGKLTEDWRKQHPDIEPASKLLERILAQGPHRQSDNTKRQREVAGDSDALFQLPKNWVWCKAYRLAEILDPQPSHRTPKEASNGVPYIGMGDVTEQGKIDFLNARKVSEQILDEHRQRYQLRKGNFIFGKIGTLGAPVLLADPFEYTLSANVVLFQPDSQITNPGFLFDYMRSPFVGAYLSKMSKATSQPAFGIKKVREMPVPLPPLEEQKEIVAEVERRLSVIEELEVAVEANLTRADRLRQSILATAFSGRLAVSKSEIVRRAKNLIAH